MNHCEVKTMIKLLSSVYKNLISELDSGKKAVVVTILDDRKNENKILLTEESLSLPDNHLIDKEIFQKAQYALKSGMLQFLNDPGNAAYLIEPFFPQPQLVVFGGGHIAKHLAEFGAKAGFLVTVIDDREKFANHERFPEANRVICDSFDKWFEHIHLNKSVFAAIITRGHLLDMDTLKQVLKYDPAYVGMVGSARKVKMVKEHLISEGYDQEKIKNVHAPIGLEIGAETPEEIAISIMAEAISYKRLVHPISDGAPIKRKWPEFDRKVLLEMSSGEDQPKAIVTVVATKGSTPRKAGSKMIVFQDGSFLGTIGGGRGEADAITLARKVIENGGYCVHRLEMTGKDAAEAGSICGGITDIVIEALTR
jgi:xanthine dehydrogenase accessory factor